MTQASQNESNTTPVPSGNEDTTPPQAETKGTTPTPEGGNAAQPDIDKIVQKRLERERKKWEAEREELERRARMDEADRLKAELADRDKRIAEAELKALTAERLADLTGKVVDPKAALRLWEDDDTLETFLERHPYMQPNTRAVAPAPQGHPDPAKSLKIEDFRGKSESWRVANYHRLKRT